jgi:hypothetical protein
MGAAAIVGTGLQAYGTYQGLKADEATLKYRAQMSRTNAAIIDKQIKSLKGAGAREAVKLEAETIQFAGEQISAYASAGIDISSSVVSEAVEQTARTGAADILTLQHNLKRQAWGLEVGKMSDELQALFDEASARSARRAAPIAVGTTLLTGFGALG